jgi:DNA-binding transcriptional LysR family regulator
MGTVDDLILLAEIIAAGSLSAASRKTGISKSTMSRRMDDLEKSLGVHLLHRGPKRFSATEIGASICERGLKIKDELSAVIGIADGHTRHPTGSLRIICPAVLSELFVAEFAIAFAKEHRDVRLTLDTSGGSFSTKMDHYDIAIQPARETLANSQLVRRKLTRAPYSLVAAPALLGSLGKEPSSLNNLKSCPGIGWAADDFSSRWKLINQNGKAAEIDVTLAFNGNNLGVIRRAALAGLGLARLPLPMCETDLREGRLVRPLANWSPPSVTVYALYSSRSSLTLAGKLFISGLALNLRENMPIS